MGWCRNRLLLLAAVICAAALLVAGCGRKQNASLGYSGQLGSDVGAFFDDSSYEMDSEYDSFFDDPSYEMDSEYDSVSGDYLTAKINGEQWDFELSSAKINHGKIEVTYIAYNPRGEKEYTLKLYFDKGISEGQYRTQDGDTNVKIVCGLLSAQGGKTGTMMGSTVPVAEAVGSYDVTISERSSDWTHYEGYFSAELGRSSMSGSNGDRSMTIKNASFSFTLN